MLGRVDGSRHVRGGDDREVAIQPVRLVRDHESEAAPLEGLELLARLGREDQDRAVGVGADESIHEAGLVPVEVERRAQHGLEVELVESIGDAGDDPREVVAVEHRGRDADQPGATGREALNVRLGAKLSCRITLSTACRVSCATSGRSFRTRDTVAMDTPASWAMSRIVARPGRSARAILTGGSLSYSR